jgi:hypothetical protein
VRHTKRPELERILSRVVESESGCWLYPIGSRHTGYGHLRNDAGRTEGVHRITYRHLVGPIPDGLHLDHLCRVRNCVNPEHLEPVTPAENVRRSYPATKTECNYGHPLDAANTKIDPRRGWRSCRTCAAAVAAAHNPVNNERLKRERAARRAAAVCGWCGVQIVGAKRMPKWCSDMCGRRARAAAKRAA